MWPSPRSEALRHAFGSPACARDPGGGLPAPRLLETGSGRRRPATPARNSRPPRRRLNLASGAPPVDPRLVLRKAGTPLRGRGYQATADPGVYLLVLPEHAHALTAAPERSIWPV